MQGRVVKFGGTSLGDAARIAAAANAVLAAQADGAVVVVVSAMAGVTDRLLDIAQLAHLDCATARAGLHQLLATLRATGTALGATDDGAPWHIDRMGVGLDRALDRIASGDARAGDSLLSGGEKLSAWLLRAALCRRGIIAAITPAEGLIRTDSRHGNAAVQRDATRAAIRRRGENYWLRAVRIVPGFTGADRHGHTTTLGRNASDYTAALLAGALGWPLDIWTDVAGCYSADPRLVPGTHLLRRLGLADAHRFARAGASVIHARTLEPFLDATPPLDAAPLVLRIVNSFAPDAECTEIGAHGEPLRGVALRDDLALLHGAAACAASDVFDRGGNLLDAAPVAAVIADAQSASAGLAVISVFDDTAAGDLAGCCRDALAIDGVTPLAVWFSSVDRALRIAVATSDGAASLRALHRRVIAGDTAAPVHVALIGANGRIGQRLLRIIQMRARELGERGIDLKLIALANSRRACFSVRAIEPDQAVRRLGVAPPADLAGFSRDLLARSERPLVLIDCSASADVAARYPHWLAAGIDIVTPNKHAPAGDAALIDALVAAERASGARLHYETTVGAQLPLLRTLRELARAGDRIDRLEAVLSGTISHVLGRVQQGAAFSEAVRDAVHSGYAEPHPAADLCGADAARKLVIVLRALGVEIGMGDIRVTPLVPPELLDEPDAERLLAGLVAVDRHWRDAVAAAAAAGEHWVYRASYSDGHARLAPERVPLAHAFARLQPCENALRLTSDYYRAAPLSVSGPGAGIDLTAAGVYADLLAAIDRRAPLPPSAIASTPAAQALRGAA